MCQVRVSEQKSRKPRRGEKFQTALLVSEDFNEESAQKAVGLPLVPLKHGINLGIDPCVQNFYLFARKWLLRHRLLSQRFRKTKEWIIQSWDRIRVMEIDWPEFALPGWSKQKPLLLFGWSRKIAYRCTDSELAARAKKSLCRCFRITLWFFDWSAQFSDSRSFLWDSVRLCIVLLWWVRYDSTVALPQNHFVGMEQGLQGPKYWVFEKLFFCLKMNFVLWQPFPQSPNDGTNEEPARSGILRILKKIEKWLNMILVLWQP